MEERGMVRILHTGDIHLDSPFTRLRAEQSEERRREMRGAFADMLSYIRENEIDIALIAGDLFDSECVTPSTVEALSAGFASCPRCRFFISPGNHDPYTKGGAYAPGRMPGNVTVFTGEALSAVDIPELNTTVWGWAFLSDRYAVAPLAGKKIENPDRLNLLCGHADVGVPLSKYAPVSPGDIAAFGARYAAFAHKHIPVAPKEAAPGCLWGYCGCMEGRSFDEPGYGGAFVLVARPRDGGYDMAWERISFARRRYEVETVDLTGVDSQAEIAGRLLRAVKEKGYGEDTVLRVIFTGATPPDFPIPREADPARLGVYAVELQDKTSPTYDAAALEKDMTVRGELYRSLLPKLTSGSPEERATAARALRMGLAALSGEDVSLL